MKFRITASVVSDERLRAVVANGPINSVAPVIEHLSTLSREFKYRKVSGRSIFAGASDEVLGTADEIDDTDGLYEFVRHRAQSSDETFETSEVETPCLALDYQVGDKVTTSPDSRDLLGYRRDNRSRWWIEGVHMDFLKQRTNLRIVRERLRY